MDLPIRQYGMGLCLLRIWASIELHFARFKLGMCNGLPPLDCYMD